MTEIMAAGKAFRAMRDRFSKIKVLVIDEDIIVDAVREALGPQAALESASNGEEGLIKMAKKDHDFILLT